MIGKRKKMKYDFDTIDIEISPELMVCYGKTNSQIDFEIWQQGDVVYNVDGHDLTLSIREMEDIVRAYKLHRDRRTAFLNKK